MLFHSLLSLANCSETSEDNLFDPAAIFIKINQGDRLTSQSKEKTDGGYQPPSKKAKT